MNDVAASSEPCPSESEVLALLCGELAPGPFARILSHTERCSSCALVVAEAGLALGETESFPASRTTAHSSRSVFSPGQLVASRYLIERRVGRGGMGEVYAALDQELNDRVALKTISSAFASDPRSVDRFKLELRLARRISHASVCRVLEFGRHELSDGASQCFFTLQFIEGVTLRRKLMEGSQLELGAALALATDLVHGLQAIHEQNVVHRDIKPENVMLPTEPRGAAAVWVDFGLARVDMSETRSGALIAGTPDYAAPELLRGELASRASDIYAFGVVLYELLTGALPFGRSASFAAAHQQARASLLPPSRLRPEVPAALDALVLECLDRAPERRPENAAQVASRIADLVRVTPSEVDEAAPSVTAAAPRSWLIRLSVVATGLLAAWCVYRAFTPPTATSAAPSLAPQAHSVATTTATIARHPPAPERRQAPKPRPAPVPPPSPRAPASDLSPVTDFGGRR